MDISEKNFESTIEDLLLAGGPDHENMDEKAIREIATAEGDYLPGMYTKRYSEDYDKSLCLLPQDVIDFIITTQPKEWNKLKKSIPGNTSDHFLARLAKEIKNRGTLDVLRKGIKDLGCKFQLCYFPPATGLNPETQRLYQANIISIIRQLNYSAINENTIDLVIFLNGLPIFTAELKNPLTGQSVNDAIRQYAITRDPKETLFTFRRCLAHFAVDPDKVFFTTQLNGSKTRFIPFNRGYQLGSGNPPNWRGFSTSYLWEQVWARDSLLNLIQYFIHEFDEEDDEGRKTGNHVLIFPRYHQLDAVRRLIVHARKNGVGQQYLIHHSAGSGKSNSIAWLAHQLSVLHDAHDKPVFDSVVIITDRRVLDRQLQRTVRQFEQTLGMVENIDKTSRQLKQALEDGKNIIVTTLQKFPVISGEIQSLPGQHFAVIIDEAHSSQSGEASRHLNTVLAATSLEEAERAEGEEDEDLEDRIIKEIKRRGHLANASYFAFTATPKPQTLELFGTKQKDGSFIPFSLYAMRQAIEEGFILDVLENYTTYKAYWNLLKTIKDDPRYDRDKAVRLLKSFVDMHEHTIGKKVEIIVEHFVNQVQHRINGHAKAMIVTRSRLHAVRYKQIVDTYLKEKGYSIRALVAFSGTVTYEGIDYTERNMNGFSETQTAGKYKEDQYKFLIVAEKFQTGFDQPLLHTMYVDKRLRGLHAVQTLSRLNRIHPPDKLETFVLDFANEAEEIQKAFTPYYEKILLTEATDPNLLYDLETQLEAYHIYEDADIQHFAEIYFSGAKDTHPRLHNALRPVIDIFNHAPKEDQSTFRDRLEKYVRLYSFLSQVIPFTDADLEKLYVFARLLQRLIKPEKELLPLEIQQAVDLESLRIAETSKGKITLSSGAGELKPPDVSQPIPPRPEEIEALSQIIQDLNRRFGTEDFTDSDRIAVALHYIEEKLVDDERVRSSVKVNTPENAKLTFGTVLNELLQEMVDTHFKFYKQVNDNADFSKALTDFLFERYRNSMQTGNGTA